MTPTATSMRPSPTLDRILEGQVALVTGSSHGIGRRIVEQLAACGARVVINGIDEANVHAVAREIDGETLALPGDVTIPTVADSLVERTVDRWGRVDIVVNNAGYNWDSPLADMSDEQFQAMLDVHVLGPFRILRAAARHLLGSSTTDRPPDTPFRKVVNISSVAGTMGNADQANYNAAKAALVGLTKGLAKEWGPQGVNVNALAPGFIKTRLTGRDSDGQTITRGNQTIPIGIPEHRRRQGSELVPLGRPGTTTEVAQAALFLCTPWSDYVHGQVLNVTGGLAMGMCS